ncbi:Uma2 family endonuclease [Coleofasciculus sp. H7-2]|uniref:Uma2 family endonuclease n=1 Tax=Coleofasciculus sp. H7-2 TaxID=3351545 RepID=UPI00366E175C
MSLAQDLNIPDDTWEDIVIPPTDLWSDEPPLESDLHRQQMDALITSLEWWWRNRNDFYVSGNLTIYYSEDQIKSRDFRGPDFFVVLGTERRPRKSWVVWGESGKYPNVIVEILSNSTADVDRGVKKQIYQDILRTPDYFWFHPVTLEFAGFHLVGGQYQPIEPNPQGWLWSQQLELYLGIHQRKLRFFTTEGQLLPIPEEVAIEVQRQAEEERQQKELAQATVEEERQQKELAQATAEEERQQKELAQARVEQLAAKLRELGIDPDA